MTETNAIESYSVENRTFSPSPEFAQGARIASREKYDELYKESIESPATFWQRETADLVFRKPWSALCEWKLPHSKWFVGAELNATESCLDRHLTTANKDKAAIIWESEPGESVSWSYAQLHEKVVAFAAVLRNLGVKLCVRNRARLAGLALPDDGRLVRDVGLQMSIETALAHVQLGADEPLRVR